MIITTKRPASILIMDTLITGAAWLAFVYQFTNGVVFLLSERHGTPSLLFGVSFSPTTTTIIVCIAVCALNATAVYLWAHLRNSSHGRAYGRMSQALTTDILADHFSLSPKQIDDVQESRVVIFYHSPTGGIIGLETGQENQSETIPPMPRPALRVA